MSTKLSVEGTLIKKKEKELISSRRTSERKEKINYEVLIGNNMQEKWKVIKKRVIDAAGRYLK